MAVRDVISITQLKNEAADLVRSITEERRTVTVTQNGEPKVVVMGADAYAELQDTLAMLKLLAQAEQQVAVAELVSSADVFERARARVRARADG